MKQIWIIAKRELHSFFDSLIAYIMLVAFLGFSGFFTWLAGSDVFTRNVADLQVFFGFAYWTLFIFIPALTMRLVAEEKRSGTIELLLTKPVTDWQFIMGKFTATLLLVIISLLLTIPYYITVARLGEIDHAATLTGYLGLILMSATYISIGLFASAITNNQIVAFLSAILIGVFFHLLSGVISMGTTGLLSRVFDYLSLNTHFESISRGVIDSKDLVYFITIIVCGLVASEVAIAKRNIADQ